MRTAHCKLRVDEVLRQLDTGLDTSVEKLRLQRHVADLDISL